MSTTTPTTTPKFVLTPEPQSAPDASSAPAPASAAPALRESAAALPLGARITCAAGALLAGSLLLPYFRLDVGGMVGGAMDAIPGDAVRTSATGFGSSTLLALLLLAAAVAAISRSVLPLAGHAVPDRLTWKLLSGAAGASLAALGWLAISPPQMLPGPGDAVASLLGHGVVPAIGFHLGLAASAAMLGGSLLLPGAPLAPATEGHPAGRLRLAIDHARTLGERQVLTSLGLGVGAPAALLLFPAAPSTLGALLGCFSLGGAIAAVVTARFARQRALASGDQTLVYLTRFGQILGWAVLGCVIAVVLFAVVAMGLFAHDVSSAMDSSWSS